MFFGIALWMRPQPGSTPEFAKALGKFMLSKQGGIIPLSIWLRPAQALPGDDEGAATQASPAGRR